MKKSIGFFSPMVLALLAMSVSSTSFGAAVNQGNIFRWNQFTKATINDWTKVGSPGYETYFELPSNVDNPNDIMDPYDATSLDVILRIQAVPDNIVVPAGTWAGYEWSIPDGELEEVVSASFPGFFFNFNPNFTELRLTDTSGNVLYSASPDPGFVSLVTPDFDSVDTIRLITYVTQAHTLFGSNNHMRTTQIVLNTVDVIPEPASMSLLMSAGGILFVFGRRRRKRGSFP